MIHFSINKNLFLQALNTTKRAISSKNAIPILSTIKIDVTNEGITLIGSNGDQEITASQVATYRGTINYEVVCLLSDRIPREYY